MVNLPFPRVWDLLGGSHTLYSSFARTELDDTFQFFCGDVHSLGVGGILSRDTEEGYLTKLT